MSFYRFFKKVRIFFFLSLSGLLLIGAAPRTSSSLSHNAKALGGRKLQLSQSYGKLPLRFEPNEGQTHP